jgi:xanthine dehydrogenase accessory factor
MPLFDSVQIVILGGGDLASGVIYRLHRAGFPVIVTELPVPLLVRRTVSYGAAVFEGEITVDGLTARLVTEPDMAHQTLTAGEIPVLIDEHGTHLQALQPTVVVDARMAKRNLGITIQAAPLVIALGPGFTAGADVHAVIETNRGHNLGRVIWQGTAEPDTGTPGSVKGKTFSRVLRAPLAGHVCARFGIGDRIREGDLIAEVSGAPIFAPFDGVLRGIIHERVAVMAGMKVGDLDPRSDQSGSFTISDKALAVGGGVLEAVLSAPVVRQRIGQHEAASGA